MCAHAAPEIFELDADGYCASDGATVPAALEAKARLGARACPESAITLIDAAVAVKD